MFTLVSLSAIEALLVINVRPQIKSSSNQSSCSHKKIYFRVVPYSEATALFANRRKEYGPEDDYHVNEEQCQVLASDQPIRTAVGEVWFCRRASDFSAKVVLRYLVRKFNQYPPGFVIDWHANFPRNTSVALLRKPLQVLV